MKSTDVHVALLSADVPPARRHRTRFGDVCKRQLSLVQVNTDLEGKCPFEGAPSVAAGAR